MVNDAVTLGIDPADGDPLRALALGYAPAAARGAVAALFALDATFAGIVRRARDPLAAQLRLAWWDEALRGLDDGVVPAGQPLLAALATEVLPRGVSGAALAASIDGWERLLAREGDEALTDYADGRGQLFVLADRLAAGGGGAIVPTAGRGWALASVGQVVPRLAAAGTALSTKPLGEAAAARWPRRARFLGALVHAVREEPSAGRVARLLVHRLTGR